MAKAPRNIAREIERHAERNLRDRLSLARQRRSDDVLASLDEATLAAMGLYHREKARAAAKGRPTLPTLDEWRNGTKELSE